jgi:hypothetical protein
MRQTILTGSLVLALTAGLGLSACGGSPSLPTTSPSGTPTVSPTPTASPTPAADYSYARPLSVTVKPECDGPAQMIYEVRSDGVFRYYPGEYNPFSTDAPKELVQRQLSSSEQQQLDNLLEEADIAKQFESSKAVEPGGPQTAECRSVLEFTMLVNGQSRTFDANGRAYQHTQAYRDAIERVRVQLEAFKNS